MSSSSIVRTTPTTATTTTTAEPSAAATVRSSTTTSTTLAERLQQARSSRRSFSRSSHSHDKNPAESASATTTATAAAGRSPVPSLNHNHRTAASVVGSTTSSSSNGYRYHHKPIFPIVDTPATTMTPPILESTGSGGGNNNNNNSNNTTAVLSQRYRSLPGFVTTTSTTVSPPPPPPPKKPSSTATTTPVTIPGGRYRPGMTMTKGAVVTEQPVSISGAPSVVPKTTATTIAAAVSTPPRTWRNIHELVHNIEANDGNYNTTSSSKNALLEGPNSHRKNNNNNNNKSLTPAQHTTDNDNRNRNVSASLSVSNSVQSQPRKYRNLHTTFLTQKESKDESIISNNSSSLISDAGRSKASASPPPPSAAEPVMNRWKYNYKSNYNKDDGNSTPLQPGNANVTTTTTTKTIAKKQTVVIVPDAPKAAAMSAVEMTPFLPVAPSPQQLAAQQYSFVPPSPTNIVGTNNNSGSVGTNSFKKKSYAVTGASDEASTLSLATSHSFASSSQSSLFSQPAPIPHAAAVAAAQLSSTTANDNHAATVTTTNIVTSTISPTSLTLSNSRSFGSHPSLSKSPTTESVASTAAISTAPSWKSNITTKKASTTSGGSVVYGSPVPAWKKKLLEQQRLQQQEQEKAIQTIPKWKQKQLLQQQQQQQQQLQAQQPSHVLDSDTITSPPVVVAATSEHIITSPSDEGRATTTVDDDDVEFEATVDHVIATALSNVAVVNDDVLASTMVGDKIQATTSVSSHQQTAKNNGNTWSHPQNSNQSKKLTGQPRYSVDTSQQPESLSTRVAGIQQQPETIAPSKSWFSKTHPIANGRSIEQRKTNAIVTADIVGVPSDDTVSIPSPDKDDPAEQSGIGESTSLLSPRRRGEMAINAHVDSSIINNNNTTVGRSASNQWESPRTARLEAMKANANTTPSSAFNRPASTVKASPVIVPNHFMKSPETTPAKKWQPPKKNEAKASTFSPVIVDVAEKRNVVIESDVSAVESGESSSIPKSSVAEMKAKLWGTGRKEKLVVAPKPVPTMTNEIVAPSIPTIGDSPHSFASPIRSSGSSDRAILMMTPPKPASALSKPAATTVILANNCTRGRPDVCTPNGPLPPPRSSSRGEQPLAPRQNLDTLWMNRIEQANNEIVASSPPRALNDDVALNSPPTTIEPNPSDNLDDTTIPFVSVNNAEYSDGVAEYINRLQNDCVQPPPPPPAERSSHHRSPSIGDFQVATNQGVKETVEDLSNDYILSPPVSPRIARSSDPVSPTIRPAVMTKWDDIPHPPLSGSISPTSRRLLPPKLPPTSPVATEKKEKSNFSETIDCPPLDDSEKWCTDADITGPKELIDSVSLSLSPRPRQDRPWTKDANTLSPSTWIKPKADPPVELHRSTPSRPPRLDPPSDGEMTGDEKKTTDDVQFQAQSSSSLMRMAADSIHAVDYDKAVQGLQRRSIMDEDDESMLSAGTPGSAIPAVLPPEFEKAMLDTGANEYISNVPVFGDPTSFGTAGGEIVAEAPVRVADRAKALESWNGGHGLSPSRPRHSVSDQAAILSPIRREESESDVEGMSPRISKRGFGLDDWKRAKSFDSKSDFETSSDFWQPSNLDNQSQVDEKDWSRCDPDVEGMNLSHSGSLNRDVIALEPAPSLSSTRTSGRGTPPLLERSKVDTDSRPRMTWKKKPLLPKPDGMSVPPRPAPKANAPKTRKSDIGNSPAPMHSGQSIQSQSTAASNNVNSFDPFDPFEFSFNNGDGKVEYTETTEFSDGTDFFNSHQDPFTIDPASFPIPQEQRATISVAETPLSTLVAPPSNDDYDDNDEQREGGRLYSDDEYLYDGEYPPTLSGLNPPSGSNLSQYEVWSYDADTSNLQDGAAEI